ncbi:MULTISPECIES: MerR family transcriptional regulator [Streptosporangium]|uniref:DNA-binding transcriptional MerR regulator n=1 Tax=Streptosporangium brasiliense TaxID=47480 RepID=A0ABT9RAH8_9ACTN|nr:MerR family transcriptional regulator [Streptosporangium brasiliense]MDP9865405.1 DNA-binding transcriptional MerR regulator [Streptosporangium brasiliense]
MRIGEAAASAGLTSRALRYYEQRGLIAARRTPSGHREYSHDDVHRLRAVRELLEAGLTIGDVQDFVHVLDMRFPSDGEVSATVTDGSSRCPVAEVTGRRLADLDRRIERLTELRARLTEALNHRFGELFLGPDQARDHRPEQAA